MAIVIDQITDVLTGEAEVAEKSLAVHVHTEFDAQETAAELGLWLAGLGAFLADGQAVGGTAQSRLVTSTLGRCIKLSARLDASGQFDIDLSRVLREGVQIGSRMEAASPAELRAWHRVVFDRLRNVPAYHSLIAQAERSGEAYLPEPLQGFVAAPPKSDEDAELALILPRFGMILKSLSLVGQMLDADEPLKPSILIFARVNEQIAELVAYINHRLERFPNEEAEIFGALDAASYTASIVLKKVFSPGLNGLLATRPAPAVYASVESAYSILNESFQQIVAGLARLVDPSAQAASLFPQSRVNFDRSIVLRRELWNLVKLTQSAEHTPEKPQIDALNSALRKFMDEALRFLFYKDTETLERFVEEILVTRQTKDLVPILHRFGAYLETLFGQVSLRAVLEDHPFER